MPVKLNSSGGGSVTIDVPSTASSFTLTAPAATATLITTGSSGQVIPKAALPTGSVLQVVQTTTNSNITTGSNSFVASGLTLSITPLSSSNKILIMLNGGNYFNTTAGGEAWTVMYRSIGGGGYSQLPAPYNQILDIAGAYSATLRISHSIMVLDSPATTSSITYQPYFSTNGTGTAYFNANSPVLTFTLMEIVG